MTASATGGPGFRAKLGVARATGALSRRSGRGGGTTLPGRLLLRLAPDAISRLGSGLVDGATIISATNGKTTTAGMLAAAMRADGRDPVHNRAGSNMSWGVATALLEQRGTEGLFEVDEAWLPRMAAELDPGLIVLGNLFRDQLDRYGELEHLAAEWGAMVERLAGRSGFVLNADDPLVADLGRDSELRRREGVTFFGVEDPSQALPELQHAHDAKHCRRCGHPYAYERAFVGHLGHYSCPNCGADRPAPEIAATEVELLGMRGSRSRIVTPGGELELELPLPGLYNVYNALAALAASLRLGIDAETAVGALASVEAAFGRVETIPVEGRPVSILLIKNPAGANEVLRTLRLEADGNKAPQQRRGSATPRRGSTCGSRSTTGSPTAATSPGSGTPTSSCSPGPRAGSSAPAPGRLRSRCGSSTPGSTRRRSRSTSRSSARSTARSPAPTGRCSRCPPTRR